MGPYSVLAMSLQLTLLLVTHWWLVVVESLTATTPGQLLLVQLLQQQLKHYLVLQLLLAYLSDIEKWHWNPCAMNQFHHQNNYLTMPHPNSSIKYNQLYCSSDKYIHPSFSEDVFMPACCSCQRKGGSPLLSDNAVRAADCCSHNSSPLLCPPQHGFISPHLKWELSLVIITLSCIRDQLIWQIKEFLYRH